MSKSSTQRLNFVTTCSAVAFLSTHGYAQPFIPKPPPKAPVPARITPGPPPKTGVERITPGVTKSATPPPLTLTPPAATGNGTSVRSTVGAFTNPARIDPEEVTGSENKSLSRFVMASCLDNKGKIWLATEGEGLWCYSPQDEQKNWKRFTVKDGLGDDNVYAVACDQQGRIWAGHLNHGVSVYNGKSWANYGVLDGPLGERVFDIAVSPLNGDVWIATSVGLTRYSVKKDEWSYVTRAEGLASDQVSCLAFTAKGDLFVGTECDGLAIASAADNYKTWRNVRGPERMPNAPQGKGLPSSLINDILITKDQTVYAGTSCGLARSFDNGLSWDYIRGADWEGRVRGLYKGPTPAKLTITGDLLLEDYVTTLAEDNAGQIWVGHWRRGCEVRDPRGDKRVDGGTQNLVAEGDYTRTILPLAGQTFFGFYGAGAQSLKLGERDREFQMPLAIPVGTTPLAVAFGVAHLSATVPAPVSLGSVQKIEPIKLIPPSGNPIEQKPAELKPSAGAMPGTPTLNQITSPVGTVEKRDAEAGRVALNTTPPLPSPAKPPSVGELNALLTKVRSLPVTPTTMLGAYWGEDWTTQGDWVGRYGRQVGVLCGVMSPFDHRFFWDSDYIIDPQIGPNHTDDSLRAWLHWRRTKRPESLYDPILGYRRQAEWDDHGETYPVTHEGPDTWVAITLPKGMHRISLYFFNKDGKDGSNRHRDYLIELKPYAPTPAEAFTLPAIARARLRDFGGGGVYKQFVVQGGDRYYIKIARNGSFNTICSGLFIDKLSGPATFYDKLPLAWLGDMQYNSPEYQNISEVTLAQPALKVEALEHAQSVWLSVGQSFTREGIVKLQRPARLLAFRAASNAGAPDKSLANWRWSLGLWTSSDREGFRAAMESAYNAQLKITPEIRGN